MTKMTYGEQLKHPLWQRKRLEVLDRAEFKCEACFDGERTLHVHHKRYVKGRLAWEYSATELLALCEDCHQKAHHDSEQLMYVVAQADANGPDRLADVVDLLSGWFTNRLLDRAIEYAVTEPCRLRIRNVGFLARQLCEAAPGAPHLSDSDVCDLAGLLDEPYVSRLKALLAEYRRDIAAASRPAEG